MAPHRTDEPETAVDPVCGMTVDPQTAAGSAEHNGRTYYFCNPRCREKFKADPESYLGDRDDEAAEAEQPEASADTRLYTCPMHPEIRQQGPGDCPKCGMDLEPAEEEPSTEGEDEEVPA